MSHGFVISALSGHILKYLSSDKGGIVHSIFSNTLNLWIEGQLITIQNCHLPLTPLSLVLKDKIKSFHHLNLEVGAGFETQPHCIKVVDQQFYIKNAQIWNGILSEEPLEVTEADIQLLRNILKIWTNSSGISEQVLGLNKTKSKAESDDPKPSLLQKKTMGGLAKALESKDIEDLLEQQEAFIDMIGVGPGLTPSGDDFLTGLLSVCHQMKNQLPHLEKFLFRLTGILYKEIHKTTDVSGAYLKFGCEGVFSQSIHGIFQGIRVKDREQTIREALTLLKSGATSGSDTLTGIMYGLSLCHSLMTGRTCR